MHYGQETTARDSMRCLLLLRQVDMHLASWQLSQAGDSLIELLALVDSDSMLHAHPRSMRNECVCSLQVSIARYLWRIGHGREATPFLQRVSLVCPPPRSLRLSEEHVHGSSLSLAAGADIGYSRGIEGCVLVWHCMP
jgi:hypothetical protein